MLLSETVLLSEYIRCVTQLEPITVNALPVTENLRKVVTEHIRERTEDIGNTLPDPNCVRHNHNLISVYCEGRIADEYVEQQAFLLPDGTSRQVVGDIAAAVVQVGKHIIERSANWGWRYDKLHLPNYPYIRPSFYSIKQRY